MANLLTPEYFQGIGEVIVVWARLESHVFKILRALTGMKMKEALVVYWQMGFRERLTVLRGLIVARHPNKGDKLRQEFEALAKRIDHAYIDRNIVAHSIWFAGVKLGDLSPFIFEARGAAVKLEGKGNKQASFDAEAFHKQALAIDRLAEDLKYFFSAHFQVRFVHKKQDMLG